MYKIQNSIQFGNEIRALTADLQAQVCFKAIEYGSHIAGFNKWLSTKAAFCHLLLVNSGSIYIGICF